MKALRSMRLRTFLINQSTLRLPPFCLMSNQQRTTTKPLINKHQDNKKLTMQFCLVRTNIFNLDEMQRAKFGLVRLSNQRPT